MTDPLPCPPAARPAPRARLFGGRMARLVGLALMLEPLGGCLAAGTRVSDVVGIDLREGTNVVRHFAPDGRSGIVALARDGGTASRVVMVMMPRLLPDRGWDLVSTLDPQTGRADPVRRTGAHDLRAIRFARAKVGGLPATLMFVATGGGRGGGALVEIDTYRLDDAAGAGGTAAFERIDERHVTDGSCSTEATLEAVEGLDPVPGVYPTGCPQA